jgi:hypothetical protein
MSLVPAVPDEHRVSDIQRAALLRHTDPGAPVVFSLLDPQRWHSENL